MTSRRNLDTQKKPPGPASPRGKSRNPDALRILPSREGRGQQPPDPALSPGTPAHSSEVSPVHETDEAALAVCFDKQGLARFLGLSVRSLDRANAMGLLPCPDLVCGRSARWSPSTIERWLRTKPRLPGRKGANHGQ